MKRACASLMCLAVLTGCESAPEDPHNAELKALVQSIIATAKEGRKERVAEMVRGLVLPEHEAWFKKVFGQETGTKLAAGYSKGLSTFEFRNVAFFEALVRQRPTVNVTRMEIVAGDNPDDFGVAYIRGSNRGVISREKFESQEKEVRKTALLSMHDPVPLYELSFMSAASQSNSKPTYLRWIVRIDGTFRMVGALEPSN